MALSMMEKAALKTDHSAWPEAIAREFERERDNPNPCVGTRLLVRERTGAGLGNPLQPGERVGFHRHVLDYFWTSVSGGRGRQHVHDGSTVEYTYQPGRDPARNLRRRRVQGARPRKSRATRRWCS